MKKGDRVRVYQDPLTERTEEGVAVLLRRLQTSIQAGLPGGRERWRVRFDGDAGEPEVDRVVNPTNIMPA